MSCSHARTIENNYQDLYFYLAIKINVYNDRLNSFSYSELRIYIVHKNIFIQNWYWAGTLNTIFSLQNYFPSIDSKRDDFINN